MSGNLARKSTIATGCLVAVGLLTTSISADARDGTMPFDTVACRDKGIIQGFADRMRATTPDQFWMYVDGLIRSGQCEKVFQGEPVSFTPLNDGGACLSTTANQPCFWTVAQPRTMTGSRRCDAHAADDHWSGGAGDDRFGHSLGHSARPDHNDRPHHDHSHPVRRAPGDDDGNKPDHALEVFVITESP